MSRALVRAARQRDCPEGLRSVLTQPDAHVHSYARRWVLVRHARSAPAYGHRGSGSAAPTGVRPGFSRLHEGFPPHVVAVPLRPLRGLLHERQELLELDRGQWQRDGLPIALARDRESERVLSFRPHEHTNRAAVRRRERPDGDHVPAPGHHPEFSAVQPRLPGSSDDRDAGLRNIPAPGTSTQ